VVLFGDEAIEVAVSEIPYVKVGPYHTNTKAGLELAQAILRRRRHANKQIFMITDGKPSALREGGRHYTNSFGLDMKIVNRTLEEAEGCRRRGMETVAGHDNGRRWGRSPGVKALACGRVRRTSRVRGGNDRCAVAGSARG